MSEDLYGKSGDTGGSQMAGFDSSSHANIVDLQSHFLNKQWVNEQYRKTMADYDMFARKYENSKSRLSLEQCELLWERALELRLLNDDINQEIRRHG